jgi:hypothetical protein
VSHSVEAEFIDVVEKGLVELLVHVAVHDFVYLFVVLLGVLLDIAEFKSHLLLGVESQLFVTHEA